MLVYSERKLELGSPVMSYGDKHGTGLEQQVSRAPSRGLVFFLVVVEFSPIRLFVQLSGLDLGSPSASEYSGSWAAAQDSPRE